MKFVKNNQEKKRVREINNPTSTSGFTLIELLIVLVISIILAVGGFLAFSSYKTRKDVSFSTNELFSVIKGIQRQAVTQKNGNTWGIRFISSSTGSDSFEIFYGASYSSSSVETSRGFRRAVEFSEPAEGRVVDLEFKAITGKLDNQKVISLRHKGGGSSVGDLIVSELGRVTRRLEDDVAGYWHFDEGTGTSTYDASGNGKSGELMNSPTWKSASDCKAGQCIELDGINQWVDLGNFDFLSGGSFTISMWLNPDTVFSDDRIISSYTPGDTNAISVRFNSNKIEIWQSEWDIISSSTIGSDQWFHLAIVIVGDSATAYINGEKELTGVQLGGNFDVNSIGIGKQLAGSGGNYFNGKVDEVRIYNTALSSSTIKAHYEDLK